MYRDCNECASKQVESFNAHDDSVRLEWHEWKTKRVERQKVEKGEVTTVTVSVTVKNKESGTAEQLVSEFQDELQTVCKHLYNISHQYTALRTLKANLVDEDILVHVDFSENYLCKYESETQSMHFGAYQKQITLHTGVAYTKDATQSFCSISDSTKHGPGAIWAHLTPILTEMKTRFPQLTNVYFVTDGPTTQYRCKTNFYLLSTKLYDLGFLVGNWNFLEAGHGKGAPDGIGAAIKREADRLVSHGKDIMDSKSLVHLLEEAGTSIKLYEVTDEDICQIEKDIPDTIKPVQGTMKIHQIQTDRPGEIYSRHVSCFCNKPERCGCFNPEKTTFDRPLPADPNVQPLEADTAPQQPVHKTGAIEADDSCLKKVTRDLLDESLQGEYVVVTYDGEPYPGIITDVDSEEIEVSVMHRIGDNRFFWPMMDDSLWYSLEHVVSLIPPPAQVTKRHREVEKHYWKEIVKCLSL